MPILFAARADLRAQRRIAVNDQHPPHMVKVEAARR